ncbi:decaprenylphospho-beta-D-erythro-pentofuranosid-2-ulose 2-reductase [Georgenia soli]|uniref:Decaprenylphospho-beta-D-erythro-pentofuranosid-2-ulose 2-reductase n=1 Tax=Georgenia soli TaxID=638953 RepID=A0A2A9ELG0_9MICO|nr:SDR family NAD(P)-dependent oxidoreductase [Georgenia soli]PFG39351.1 decaprenylphospho-beta-D-erythro-pentofuranosid-2-ulose 2-reductase [Georgenia soli]
MLNVLGQPGTVLALGGSSEIAQAFLGRLLESRACDVVLAARPSARRDAAVRRLEGYGARVEPVDVDAADSEGLVAALRTALAGHEVDLAVIAHGVLPDEGALGRRPADAADVVAVNLGSAVAAGLLLADLMRRQGHGVLVVLSSVAAVRPRASNAVYGATKAGLDAFFTALRDRLRGSGVRVVVVRPGFVRTRMTAGRAPAPFAVDADDVARAVLAGLDRDVVWVPAVLGPLTAALRLVPGPVWRRLDRRSVRDGGTVRPGAAPRRGGDRR